MVCDDDILQLQPSFYLHKKNKRDEKLVCQEKYLCIFAHQGWQIHSAILEKCSGVDLSPLTCEEDICDEEFESCQCANFNQTWHKAFFGKGDSSSFQLIRAMSFSQGRWLQNSESTLTKLQNQIKGCHFDMNKIHYLRLLILSISL